MWIFTKYGFYSAVCARQGDGSHGQPVDPDRIMVRARVRSHLEGLQARFPEQLGNCTVEQFPFSDYAYRFFLDKKTWASVVTELVSETDYDNFKSEVRLHQGSAGADYEEALHRVWGDMMRLQSAKAH